MSPPSPLGFPTIPLLALGALLVLTVATVRLRSGKPWLQRIQRIQRKPLMTENEKGFVRTLQRALPVYHVFPQVSFAALLTDNGGRKRMAVRARFDRKIADFVVCDRETCDIVALVELDDRTHSAAKDRYRDELTKAAGYMAIRFQSKKKPTESEIAELLKRSASVAASKEPEQRRAKSGEIAHRLT